MKCENCKRKIVRIHSHVEPWEFGKIVFCGNSCAIAWCVKELLKKK